MEKLCDDVLEAEAKLIKEKEKMTVIVAMRESDDSILIGADSMNLESNLLKAASEGKLFKHNKESVVWGCSGSRGIARDDFSPWLQSLDIDGDWPKFKTRVADKIAELNGEQRIRAKKAGVEPIPDMVISCLLVGWLNGEPQILEFTDDGRIESYIKDGFRSIGSGWVVATGVYGSMLRINGIDNWGKFYIILDTAMRAVATCGGNSVIMRVKRDGVEDAKDSKQQAEDLHQA